MSSMVTDASAMFVDKTTCRWVASGSHGSPVLCKCHSPFLCTFRVAAMAPSSVQEGIEAEDPPGTRWRARAPAPTQNSESDSVTLATEYS